MEMTNDINKYYSVISDMAYEKYCDELKNHKLIPQNQN